MMQKTSTPRFMLYVLLPLALLWFGLRQFTAVPLDIATVVVVGLAVASFVVWKARGKRRSAGRSSSDR